MNHTTNSSICLLNIFRQIEKYSNIKSDDHVKIDNYILSDALLNALGIFKDQDIIINFEKDLCPIPIELLILSTISVMEPKKILILINDISISFNLSVWNDSYEYPYYYYHYKIEINYGKFNLKGCKAHGENEIKTQDILDYLRFFFNIRMSTSKNKYVHNGPILSELMPKYFTHYFLPVDKIYSDLSEDDYLILCTDKTYGYSLPYQGGMSEYPFFGPCCLVDKVINKKINIIPSQYHSYRIINGGIQIVPNWVLEYEIDIENISDNITLYGLNHVYSCVEIMFFFEDPQEMHEFAKKIGADTDGNIQANILTKLNNIQQ